MNKSCCIRRTLSVFIAMAAFALAYPGASAQGAVGAGAQAKPISLMGTLQAAERAAQAGRQQGVALLVLQNDPSSQTAKAIVVHDAAVRYALRHFDLVVLQRNAHRGYGLGELGDSCEGVGACAEDAFLGKAFSPRELQQLDPAAARLPVLLVFKTGASRPSATAYGIDSPHQMLRMAAGLQHASASHPLVQYAKEVLED